MFKTMVGLGCAIGLVMASSAQAAYLLEVDTDGLDDGVLTFHANFAFGGDTTTASQSISSTAIGMTGGDSIFGGDGSAFDTYTYSYTPAVDGDSVNLAGQALNTSGDIGSALVAGGSGDYDVYATWPFTSSVSGGLTTYTLSDINGPLFSVQIDQNNGVNGAGNEWIYLGTGTLDANTTYTLTQQSGAATFVSMRSAGILFDAVPEPASLGLMGIGLLTGLGRKHR